MLDLLITRVLVANCIYNPVFHSCHQLYGNIKIDNAIVETVTVPY